MKRKEEEGEKKRRRRKKKERRREEEGSLQETPTREEVGPVLPATSGRYYRPAQVPPASATSAAREEGFRYLRPEPPPRPGRYLRPRYRRRVQAPWTPTRECLYFPVP
jgi:hypothetical protein